MVRFAVTALAAALLLAPAIAQAQYGTNSNTYGGGGTYSPYGSPTYGNYWDRQGSSPIPPGYTVTAPGTPVSPLQPGRRLYPQQPTLGDPRGYRLTDPTRCTSLLCD